VTTYNIGINGAVLEAKKHGISRYTRQLLSGLTQTDPSKFSFTVFTDAEEQDIGAISTVDINNRRTLQRIIWDTIGFSRKAGSTGIDVVHSPDKGPLINPGVPLVATIHDLLPYLYPKERPLPNRKYWQLSLRRQATLSDAIITVSESTKRDLLDVFDVERDKVYVTPLGTDLSPPSDTEVDNVVQEYDIDTANSTVLYVGNYNERKNVDRLVSACRDASVNLHLLLAGSDPPREDLSRVAGNFQDEIRFLGYVPDEDIEALYGAADLFVYPSSYEGFGLPVLEAMACGTPVVTSNTSSLPEVAGDAGLTVDPGDSSALTAAIERVCSDTDLQYEMRQDGLRRAEGMTWDSTARKTIRAYEEVV